MDYIEKKYSAEKFIAYFQNYSNTYLPYDKFKDNIMSACIEKIAAIYISTRPDCINDKYLALLRDVSIAEGIDFVIELGLQSVNYRTLSFLNRGHGLAEFIDAVNRIKSYGLECCVHYIVDLPMENEMDIIEGAKIISALNVEQVKCHSLYILKDTRLGDMYLKGEISPISMDKYIERVVTFLEYLSPTITIQRILGRAPKERTLFCNWSTSWRRLQDIVEDKMEKENRFQGKHFNYLNGAALKNHYET